MGDFYAPFGTIDPALLTKKGPEEEFGELAFLFVSPDGFNEKPKPNSSPDVFMTKSGAKKDLPNEGNFSRLILPDLRELPAALRPANVNGAEPQMASPAQPIPSLESPADSAYSNIEGFTFNSDFDPDLLLPNTSNFDNSGMVESEDVFTPAELENLNYNLNRFADVNFNVNSGLDLNFNDSNLVLNTPVENLNNGNFNYNFETQVENLAESLAKIENPHYDLNFDHVPSPELEEMPAAAALHEQAPPNAFNPPRKAAQKVRKARQKTILKNNENTTKEIREEQMKTAKQWLQLSIGAMPNIVDNQVALPQNPHEETLLFYTVSQYKFGISNKWSTQIDRVLTWVKAHPAQPFPQAFAENYYTWVAWVINVELPQKTPRGQEITWPLKRKQLNKLDKEVPPEVVVAFKDFATTSVDTYTKLHSTPLRAIKMI